jgi:hypothetical protein
VSVYRHRLHISSVEFLVLTPFTNPAVSIFATTALVLFMPPISYGPIGTEPISNSVLWGNFWVMLVGEAILSDALVAYASRAGWISGVKVDLPVRQTRIPLTRRNSLTQPPTNLPDRVEDTGQDGNGRVIHDPGVRPRDRSYERTDKFMFYQLGAPCGRKGVGTWRLRRLHAEPVPAGRQRSERAVPERNGRDVVNRKAHGGELFLGRRGCDAHSLVLEGGVA